MAARMPESSTTPYGELLRRCSGQKAAPGGSTLATEEAALLYWHCTGSTVLGARPRPRLLELAASKVADLAAFGRPGDRREGSSSRSIRLQAEIPMVTGWGTYGYRRERRKQLRKLKRIAKKISPDGMALRAAICCWLDAASEGRKMKRAMKRMMNRALAGAYTTWAADIMGQRGIGKQSAVSSKQ